MDQSDKELVSALSSNDPIRIEPAIHGLIERMKQGKEIQMAPFGAEILDAFGAQAPEQTQRDFVTLITRYHSFVPKLSEQEKIAALIVLALRYANRYVIFEIATKLKIAAAPIAAVEMAMREIPRQGLTSSQHILGAKYVVSRLLDGKDNVRRATLEQLRQWPSESVYSEVAEYIKPQLNEEERRFLTETGSS